MQLAHVILFVADMSRSVAFYRDLLGIALRFESPEWTEFETGGTTLALHPGEGPPISGSASAPGQCRPGLSVPDLDAFHERVTGAGTRCVQTPRDVFGVRIAQYADPDGIVISVSEQRR